MEGKSVRKIFSNNLKNILKEKGIEQQDLAIKIGISPSSISQWISCQKYPRINTILKIADYLNVSYDDLTSDKNVIPNRSYSIPILGSIAAGIPILAQENIEDYYTIDARINADFALKVKGESMIDDHIFNNDLVFIKQTPICENGSIAAVLIGEEATLKRFYKNGNQIILQPANSKFQPIIYNTETINENIKILGTLKAVLHIESNS